MQKGDILKKTLQPSLNPTRASITQLLFSVGDMALKRRARRIIEELDLKDGQSLLEIGCGNGYYLKLINRLGINLKLTGLDNDPRALKDAQTFIGDKKVKLVMHNAEKLPFPAASFDRVIISEVIEHIEDEEKVLAEIYRVLKPKGLMILTTCNIDYPFLWDPVNWVLQHGFKTHFKNGFWAGIWNQHIRLYKINDLERLIKKSKFKIEDSEFLTRWCLPFNHYLVNYVARLFYQGSLPKNITKGINKFENEHAIAPIRFMLWTINTFDTLNDLFPGENGVSIFIKARK